MNAYKCDICKKYFEHYVTEFMNKDIRYFDKVSFHVSNLRFDETVTLDVCPKCMMKLMKDAKIDNMKYSFDDRKAKIIEGDGI